MPSLGKVPSSTSQLAGQIIGMASCFRKELFSSYVNMCSVFRILEARRLEVFAAQRWKRRRTGQLGNLTPSLVVLLHPAAIHLVDIAGKLQEKNFSNVQTHVQDLNVLARTCVRCSIEAKSSSTDVTKGVGGVTPYITLFNLLNI